MGKARKIGIKSTYVPNAKADMRRRKGEGFYFAMRNPNIDYGYRTPAGCLDRKPREKEV